MRKLNEDGPERTSTSRCPVPVTGPRAAAGGLAGVDPLGPGGDFGDAVDRRGLESPAFKALSAMVAWWIGRVSAGCKSPHTDAFTSGKGSYQLR